MSERWSNPLTVAVIAAALAGFSSIYLAYVNNRAEVALEASKAESDRILEVLKIGEPERVRENLRFLLQLGLVKDDALRRRIEAWDANPNRAPVYLSGDRRAAASPQCQPRRPNETPSASAAGRSGY